MKLDLSNPQAALDAVEYLQDAYNKALQRAMLDVTADYIHAALDNLDRIKIDILQTLEPAPNA